MSVVGHHGRTLAVVFAMVAASSCGRHDRTPIPDEASGPPAMPVRVTATDGSLVVVLPAEFVAHSFEGAVMAATPDGSFRLHVSRLAEEKLIRAAGQGKETMMARGWLVTGEQHFERAIHVQLRRGGTAARPKGQRHVWWIYRLGAIVHCDGVASAEGASWLGDPLRSICQQVILASNAGHPRSP